MTSLAERLGYDADARLLILNCDDLGSAHAANLAVYEALRDGVATSASLMVPCPWARDAAHRYLGEDVGVHLTLNAEWDIYRWGPITQAPSLLDGDGGFPRTLEDLWDHGDIDEVRRECRAQVERAILWGFDVSHLDSHMGGLQLKAEFFDVYLELAVDFGLPLRLLGSLDRAPDRLPVPASWPRRRAWCSPTTSSTCRASAAGPRYRRRCSTCARASPRSTSIPPSTPPSCGPRSPTAAARIDDHELVTSDTGIRAMIERSGVQLIGFRELRDLQRAG